MERTHNSRPSKVGHTVARPRNTREKVKRKKNPFAFVRIRIQLLSVRLNVNEKKIIISDIAVSQLELQSFP